jgi:Uma2 family endonuclease
MPRAIRHAITSTIAAYDAFVDARIDADEFELVDGAIVMMANPTETHEQIASNIGAPLKLAMDQRGCRSYQGGIRVQRSDDKDEVDKTRPDVVVRCGPASKRTYITDPVVIVEVLSPSTIDRDTNRCPPSSTSRWSIRTRCASSTTGVPTQVSTSKC